MQLDRASRRDFVTVLAGVAAWPFATEAQPTTPLIGFLSGGLSRENENALAAFGKGLNEVGYSIGQNVAVEILTTDKNDGLPVDFHASAAGRASFINGSALHLHVDFLRCF